MLATECLKVFETAGVRTSDHLVIAKAVKLCTAYVLQSTGHKGTTLSSIFAALWKEQACMRTSTSVLPIEDAKDLATSILRENLVDTLTEKAQ